MDQLVTLSWPTTPEEFLAWEQRQEDKHEFDGRTVLPINGGTWEHALIEGNVYHELRLLLEGSAFRPYGATLKVEIGMSYRYPDGVVSRAEPERGSRLIPEPIVLFEVVSATSETTDRRTKLREYRSLPSVQRYVLLEQDECALTVYARAGAGWTVETLGAGDMLAMPEIRVTLAIDTIYKDVLPPS